MKMLDQKCGKCRKAIIRDAAGALPAEQRLDMELHLANCVACRACSSELRAVADGLRRLSAQPVNPDPHFRSRWTAAVKKAGRPKSWQRAAADLIEGIRLMVLRNRRTIAGLAPAWALIFLFKLTAPDVVGPAPRTVARSPIEIFRALKAGNNMQVTFARMNQDPLPRKAPAAAPRSSRTTTQPVTFRRESGINPEPIFLS